MPFVKGEAKGRPPGIPNKGPYQIKDIIEAVFRKRGGAKALLEWSNEHPTEFYQLWGKLLPKDINVHSEITLRELVMQAIQVSVTGLPAAPVAPALPAAPSYVPALPAPVPQADPVAKILREMDAPPPPSRAEARAKWIKEEREYLAAQDDESAPPDQSANGSHPAKS